ncbi:hypothetical protein AB0L88_09445 [Saccharopolyspora shandongensis]|uniref:hypothetical protein n=1 Tax=Saccharopolyspora shandongensis TaxID=418495 RepID=UPI00341204BA
MTTATLPVVGWVRLRHFVWSVAGDPDATLDSIEMRHPANRLPVALADVISANALAV